LYPEVVAPDGSGKPKRPDTTFLLIPITVDVKGVNPASKSVIQRTLEKHKQDRTEAAKRLYQAAAVARGETLIVPFFDTLGGISPELKAVMKGLVEASGRPHPPTELNQEMMALSIVIARSVGRILLRHHLPVRTP
jgi:hypothetical protein